jgi:pimeloyl-ACP methyl ester carboxylesterase
VEGQRAVRHGRRRRRAQGAGLHRPDSSRRDPVSPCAAVRSAVRHRQPFPTRTVDFCGISMGGLTGLWLGVHAGSRLRWLVVANSAARIGTAEGWTARAQQVLAHGMDPIAAGAAGRWFTPGFRARAPASVDGLVGHCRHAIRGAMRPAALSSRPVHLAHLTVQLYGVSSAKAGHRIRT